MSLLWEIEELACLACGKSEEETDEIINDGAVDDLLLGKYDIDFEQYYDIVKDLIPFTTPVRTAITDTVCKGFVDGGRFIVKVECEDV